LRGKKAYKSWKKVPEGKKRRAEKGKGKRNTPVNWGSRPKMF